MSDLQIRRSWQRMLLGAYVLGLVSSLSAAPIKYQLTIPNASAQLGSQSFSNVQVVFTFIGDDANVLSGTAPSGIPNVPDIRFSVIYQGSASVTLNGPGAAQTTAVFAPNQVVVTIDHSNEGIGFGFVSGGVASSGFDVSKLQPVYPAAITDYADFPGITQTHTGWKEYDLTFAYAASHNNIFGGEFHADGSVDISAAVYSCNGFGGSIYYISCTAPAPIPTNLGAFTINQIIEPTLTGMGTVILGEFTATTAPPASPSPPNNLSITVH